jgi:hypothetical protein
MKLSGELSLSDLFGGLTYCAISATPLSAAWLKRIRGGEFIENNAHPETDVNDPSIEDSCGGISLVIPLRFLHNDELEIDLVQWERNRLGTLTGELFLSFFSECFRFSHTKSNAKRK